MPYTQEQIQKQYDRLPADIKEAIDSVSTTSTIVDIGQRHNLMYDQISELVDEIGLVMIGFTPSAMFVNNIARRMQVDIGTAMLVAKDINKEILDRMRDSLKKIEEEHGEDTEGYSDESGNVAPEKPAPGMSEETMLTDAEKVQKASVVSAVEKAGGFVIDKQEDAPLKAEEIVHDAMKESLETKKDIVNVLEKESFAPSTTSVKIEPPVSAELLLGDTPDTAVAPAPVQQNASATVPATEATPTASAQKQPDQASIVDTLLSKGVAMVMDDGPTKQAPGPKETPKVRPYDGTDPYREPIK